MANEQTCILRDRSILSDLTAYRYYIDFSELSEKYFSNQISSLRSE